MQEEHNTYTDGSMTDEEKAARSLFTDTASRMSPWEESRLWDRIRESQNAYNRMRKFRTALRIAGLAAAVCLLLAVPAWYWLSPSPEKEIDYAALMGASPAILTPDDITLVLSEDKEISVSGKEAEVDYQQGYVHMKTEGQATEKKEEVDEAFNQLIVPKGKRSFVTLTDGTKMWVNAGTVVIYPVEFSGSKREIYVEGEVYLDVVPDRKKPFIVKTGDLSVEVLGTRFDVSAYAGDPFHSVTLVEGKIEVGLPDKTKQILRPNQQFCYNSHTWDIHEIKDLNHLAWIHGYYQYKDQPLSLVVNGLVKYYGNRITYDSGVSQLICSGKLDIKNDIREVLETLQDATPIQVSYVNGKDIHIHVKPDK